MFVISRHLKDFARFVISLLEMFLALRFLLKLLVANPRSEFVSWVYQNTNPVLEPFFFAFPTPSVSGGHVIEFTTLFAMFVYAFLGYILMEVLDMTGFRSSRKK
jgi:predicted SAM-dependent methyltransferase